MKIAQIAPLAESFGVVSALPVPRADSNISRTERRNMTESKISLSRRKAVGGGYGGGGRSCIASPFDGERK